MKLLNIRFISTFLFASFLSSATFSQDLNSLNLMTEEYPPLNYSENGQLKGEAVDLLVKATEAVGSPVDLSKVKIEAWARAYKIAQSGPNAMLFSMSRTEERENFFKWAGPIAENRTILLAKKSSGIGQISDVGAISEKVGVVREDVGEQLAISAGIPTKVLVKNSKPEGIAKMLAGDRVKLWAYPEESALLILKNIGENVDDYEIVHVLKTTGLYYAFSKDVDDSVVAKLQEGIDKVK